MCPLLVEVLESLHIHTVRKGVGCVLTSAHLHPGSTGRRLCSSIDSHVLLSQPQLGQALKFVGGGLSYSQQSPETQHLAARSLWRGDIQAKAAGRALLGAPRPVSGYRLSSSAWKVLGGCWFGFEMMFE